jgi:hypothetical protein
VAPEIGAAASATVWRASEKSGENGGVPPDHISAYISEGGSKGSPFFHFINMI